jgi:hypothetical protein
MNGYGYLCASDPRPAPKPQINLNPRSSGGTDNRVARFGPTTPTRARRPFDASVDPTEARNCPTRRARAPTTRNVWLMNDWTARRVAVHGVGSRESGDFDSRGAIGRSDGAMPPTEPSGATMSGRPARRRPGRRHSATTRSIDSVSRLPERKSVPSPSRGSVTASRQARSAVRKNTGES